MSYRPTRMLPAGPVRGPARGMPVPVLGAMPMPMGGDSASDPVAQLAAQVNRFGPGAPAAYQFTSKAFPLASGVVNPELALVALTIYQRRATEGYSQIHDAGSLAAITRANLGYGDPVGFVTANLADVLTTVGGFADSLGLPGPDAGDGTIAGTFAGIDTRTLLLVAGGALVLWMVTR